MVRIVPMVPAAALIAGLAAPAHAQRAITGARTAYDFDAYAGAGLAPTPAAGQLDSDEWRVTGLPAGDTSDGGTHDAGEYARGASGGGVSLGGLYAFEVAPGDRAFGWQAATGFLEPGTFTLRLVNDTGAPLTAPTIRYEVWVRNDSRRSTDVQLAWSTDGASFTPEPSATVVSPFAEDGAPAWAMTPREITLAGATIAPGGPLHLRWTTNHVPMPSAMGGRDELAIDDVEVLVELPAPVDPDCGDGSVDDGEACDDGNDEDGDGCSAACEVEPGYTCSGEPSTCLDDRDGDGVPDDVDNCPDVPNPSQADHDEDGLGNACDELPEAPPPGCCAAAPGAPAGGLALAALVALALGRRRRR